MKKNSKKQIIKCFENLKSFNLQLLDDLDKAIFDYELIMNKYSIYFAMDYYNLYQFAFRSSNILSEYIKYKKKIPVESERIKIVKYQAALAYLFYGKTHWEPPLLLPPHILELRDSIIYEQFRNIERKLRYKAIKNWGSNLFTSREKQLITELEVWYQSNNYESELPHNLFEKVVELSFNRFSDILFVISGLATEDLKILKELISGKNPRLQLNSELCKNYDSIIKNVIMDPDSEVYELFSKIRENRIVSNKRDAKLIDIVLALNDEFMRKKEKKIIYILSDAPAMDIIFNPQRHPEMNENLQLQMNLTKIYPLTSEKFSIFRSTSIFLLYMMAAGDNPADTLLNLRSMRSKLRTFNTSFPMIQDFIDHCEDKCSLCTKEQKNICKEMQSLITNQQKEHEGLVSLSIIYNRFPYLDQFIRHGFVSGFEIENSIRAIANFLIGKIDKLEQMVENKEDEIQKQLDETMITLREKIIELADESIEDLIYRLKRGRGIPFKINFINNNIAEQIEKINKYVSQDKSIVEMNTLKNYSSQLFHLIDDETIGDERYLLLSILCYNFHLLDWVISITSECILNPNILHIQDYLLVNLMASHQRAINRKDKITYLNILNKCNNLINKYHSDPRFHYMFGVIIGRGIQTNIEKEKTLDQAINYFNKALNLSEENRDNLFIATIYNSIAYAISLKDELTKNDLDTALEAIKKMEKIVPLQDWDANFLDTKGVVYYYLGKFNTDEKLRLEFLLESKKLLNCAKDLADKHHFFQYEKDSIKENLKRTVDLINKSI